MEQQFLAEAELIKGLPKILKDMTETKIKGFGTSSEKRTRELVDLKIDEEFQTACFILDEKIERENGCSYDARIIGVYHEGLQNYSCPLYYHYPHLDIDDPSRKYVSIDHIGFFISESHMERIRVKCSSKQQKISGTFSFSK